MVGSPVIGSGATGLLNGAPPSRARPAAAGLCNRHRPLALQGDLGVRAAPVFRQDRLPERRRRRPRAELADRRRAQQVDRRGVRWDHDPGRLELAAKAHRPVADPKPAAAPPVREVRLGLRDDAS